MFGKVEGDATHRVERNRTADGKRWKFMVSDSITYRYESAIYEWIKNRKTNENI